MTDQDQPHDLRELRDATMPVSWAAGALISLLTAAGTALLMMFVIGGWKGSVDRDIAELKASDVAQARTLRTLPTWMTRMEMISCATDDPQRKAMCNQLNLHPREQNED